MLKDPVVSFSGKRNKNRHSPLTNYILAAFRVKGDEGDADLREDEALEGRAVHAELEGDASIAPAVHDPLADAAVRGREKGDGFPDVLSAAFRGDNALVIRDEIETDRGVIVFAVYLSYFVLVLEDEHAFTSTPSMCADLLELFSSAPAPRQSRTSDCPESHQRLAQVAPATCPSCTSDFPDLHQRLPRVAGASSTHHDTVI